jgi:flagellar biosynthesis protein FlhB
MIAGSRDVVASAICVVAIMSALAIVEPRAVGWLKVRIGAVASAPLEMLADVSTAVGQAVENAAGRIGLTRAPVLVLAVVAATLVILLLRL